MARSPKNAPGGRKHERPDVIGKFGIGKLATACALSTSWRADRYADWRSWSVATPAPRPAPPIMV